MENSSTKIGTSAFLITIVSTTELPYFIKYPMLGVAIISLIVAGYQYTKEKKATTLPKQSEE